MVYLPLYKVAYTVAHIQWDDIMTLCIMLHIYDMYYRCMNDYHYMIKDFIYHDDFRLFPN